MITAKIQSSTCPMDCPDTCALEVEVRDGRVQRLGGSQEDQLTKGFICSKVRRFARRVYHPDRILYPMRRVGRKGSGQFERISWDDAIAEIAARFNEIIRAEGGEAILPYTYGGSNGFFTDESLDNYFFSRIGASRLAKTFCAAPSTEVAVGMYGKMPGVAFEDYVHARCILIWGANPRVSNIHLVPFLRLAKSRGAFIAVIDPRRTFSENEVDLHLAVLPGTDLPVALAMIHEWVEQRRLDWSFLKKHAKGWEPLVQASREWPAARAAAAAGVDADAIRRLAREYAERNPAVIRCGWGMERNRNGGHALAAIMAMPALLGKFGVRGGGYTMSNSGAIRFESQRVFGPDRWETRELNMSQLGRILTQALSPPIRALFVYNANPAVTAPNQQAVLEGLSREDLFTVVHEQVFTDTAKFADIVLPAPTFLEQHELKKGYGNYVLAHSTPVIPARGEARPNWMVFRMLGQAMGLQDPPFAWDEETFYRAVIEGLEPCAGAQFDRVRLYSRSHIRLTFSGSTPIQFGNVYPGTGDGKADLTPACLGPTPYHFTPGGTPYPLHLITPASEKMITSTMGEYNFDQLYVEMHPLDAAERGIGSGSRVRVYNELGEVICHVRITSRIRRGVVAMPKGAWRKSSLNGYTSTALCPDHVNEVGGGACYNDARVEVERFVQEG